MRVSKQASGGSAGGIVEVTVEGVRRRRKQQLKIATQSMLLTGGTYNRTCVNFNAREHRLRLISVNLPRGREWDWETKLVKQKQTLSSHSRACAMRKRLM